MHESEVINIGPLTSLSSLNYYLSKKIGSIRDSYANGSTPDFIFDLTHLQYKSISIAALTALLSTSKRIRDFIGYPIPALLKWDPLVQGFLNDIGFFEISQKFKIFDWRPERIVGGFVRGTTNSSTRILYFADVHPENRLTFDSLGSLKAQLKQKIRPNFSLRCESILHDIEGLNADIINKATLELIVNSLIHGQEIAFVGIQRSKRGVTISVCDSGIGFPRSLKKIFGNDHKLSNLSNIEGIVVGSLIQKNEHGLRQAISEITNIKEALDVGNYENEGWVVISSYDSEIRWQKANWVMACDKTENINFVDGAGFNYIDIIGDPVSGYQTSESFYGGYWKKYNDFLIGTRITFEVPLRQVKKFDY